MADIEYIRNTTRKRIESLVVSYEAKGFSREEALKRAGSQIGRSEHWVERILSRRPSVSILALDWLRLELIVAKIEASTARIDRNTALVLERTRENKKRKRTAESDLVMGDFAGAEFLGARLGGMK